MFTVNLQPRPGGKWRVVMMSTSNGKLVLAGETLNNKADAEVVQQSICTPGTVAWGEPLSIDHKFPTNSGPRKGTRK